MSNDVIQFPYTVTQAAVILGTSENGVRVLIRNGELKAEPRGNGTVRRSYVIHPDAIAAYRQRKLDCVNRNITDRTYADVIDRHSVSSSKGDRGRGRLRL